MEDVLTALHARLRSARRSLLAPVLFLALTVGLVASTTLIAPTPAFAGSYNCTNYKHGLTIPKTGVKMSRICVDVKGNKLKIDKIVPTFFTVTAAEGIGLLCDTSFTSEIRDEQGQVVKTYRSKVDRGCRKSGGGAIFNVNMTMKGSGNIRTTLYSRGAEMGAVEQDIHS